MHYPKSKIIYMPERHCHRYNCLKKNRTGNIEFNHLLSSSDLMGDRKQSFAEAEPSHKQ